MTRSEYEQRRRSLEQQLQSDLELLRAAHETRLRALDHLWLALTEEGAVPPTVPIGTKTGIGTQIGTQAPPPKADPVRRGYGVVRADAEEALARLPEVFDKVALVQELGYEPPRSTLHRTLEELLIEKKIVIDSHSSGRSRTRYRKLRNPETQEA